MERHRENIDATVTVFRTAYECAMSHLPCTEHSHLITLQALNGVRCGNILYSNHACSSIVNHISEEMRSEIVSHIVDTGADFSIMVHDESTSVSNVQSLIVYVRTRFDGEVSTYFLGLIVVDNATASGLENALITFLHGIGLNDEVLRAHFVGFCSDGASCVIGEHRDVATLLKAKYPLLHSFHCMAHRLELAVKQLVDTVNAVSHFRCFVYKVYSMSPKNQRELVAVAESLSVELLRYRKFLMCAGIKNRQAG